MTRLDTWLAYAESHNAKTIASAFGLLCLIAAADWSFPLLSIGFLYLVPILISAVALDSLQIIGLSAFCSFLEEAFSPTPWSVGALDRLILVGIGFAMAGFFVVQLNQRRRLLGRHVYDLEAEVKRRQDAEARINTLIETTPLAILTIDNAGRVLVSNEAARKVLEFQSSTLQGVNVSPYLPILPRMFQKLHLSGSMCTKVECDAKRRTGQIFLADVWLSTYGTSKGPELAAVIWDASEDLRDRESAGLDSMLATSRVLMSAVSHEIRNLASAAAVSYEALNSLQGTAGNRHFEALGSLIHALKKIAMSGLQLTSERETVVTDLSTVLNEARIVIEPLLDEDGIHSVWELSPHLPVVEADRQSLLQVFLNLARNAKSALREYERREIAVTAGTEREFVVVRFYDTGPGVANPENLFRPFQPGAEFTGLGLFISRAILRSHGGDLKYEPQAAGSCFAVELRRKEEL